MDYTAVEKGKEQSTSKLRESPPLEPESITWTPTEEKALLRRIDWHILPGLSILYLLCFLDRT
jgi:hypothetical protein